MTRFYADIGTWERGFHIGLPDADDLSSALKVAGAKLEEKFGKDDEKNFIVQVFDGKKIVWDYMNGNLERQQSEYQDI